jgi:hypothetical protein
MEKKDIFYYAFLIIVMIFCCYLIFFLTTETSQCLKNPFVYGASKMKNVECSCIQFNNPVCPARFSFTDDKFNEQTIICGTGLIQKVDYRNLNVSNIYKE